MISKNIIKEIILSNRAFILESVSRIVPRAAAEVVAPGKTVIMHGIRRSGKTFILYDILRRFKSVPPTVSLWFASASGEKKFGTGKIDDYGFAESIDIKEEYVL